jgi:hypothetical protein
VTKISAPSDIPAATRQDAAVAGPTAAVTVVAGPIAVMHPGGDTVRRARRTRPSTDVPSDVIRDASISIRALGLLVVFLDLPEDVPIATDQFAGQGNREGRDALRKAMSELITAQYATRRKWQDDRGRWHTETVVYDTRQSVDNSAPNDVSAGRTDDGFPGVGFPVNKSQRQDLKTKDQNHLAGAGAGAHAREDASSVLDDDLLEVIRKQVKFRHKVDITGDEARELLTAFRKRRGAQPTANPAGWIAKCIENEPDIRAMLSPRPAAARPPRGTCGTCDPSSAMTLDENGYPDRPCPTCRPEAYAHQRIAAIASGFRVPA